MPDKDIIMCLFDRKQDINHFRSTDEILKNCIKVINKTDNDLDNFAIQNIPPCLRRPFQRIIEEKDAANYDYSERENFLYYSSVFSDALNLILSNVISDNDCSI